MDTVFHSSPALIGDTLLTEPAITAYARSINKVVDLYVEPHMRSLYNNHPHINLLDEIKPESKMLDCSKAFTKAFQNNWYFGAGFFEQVGLEYVPGMRCHFGLYGDPFLRVPDKGKYILIAPFGRTCSVHTTGIPNKTIHIEWWERLVEEIPNQVISLGSVEDPRIRNTINLRGIDLRTVAELMYDCRCLISIETGLLHLAAACCERVIYLNSATPSWFCAPIHPTNCTVMSNPSRPFWEHTRVMQIVNRMTASFDSREDFAKERQKRLEF